MNLPKRMNLLQNNGKQMYTNYGFTEDLAGTSTGNYVSVATTMPSVYPHVVLFGCSSACFEINNCEAPAARLLST